LAAEIQSTMVFANKIEMMADIYEIGANELISRNRRKELGLARRTQVNYCREYTRITNREMAEAFGNTESARSKMLAWGERRCGGQYSKGQVFRPDP